MTQETRTMIERLVTVGVTAALSIGGTYTVKQNQLDAVEAQVIAIAQGMTRLEGIVDVCRGVLYANQPREYYSGANEQMTIQRAEDTGQNGGAP